MSDPACGFPGILDLLHAPSRQRQGGGGRLLGLLDDGVQGVEQAVVEADEHPCDSIAGEGGANLPKSSAERPAERHAHRPAELHAEQVGSNRQPIIPVQRLQPVPHRLGSSRASVEDQPDPGRLALTHSGLATVDMAP
jgi:hypothetical protein